MKRLFTILVVAAFGVTSVPSFANIWQWQLDQIKADQQRRAKCRAAEQAKVLLDKMHDAQKKAAPPVTTPPAK